jgi:hypothetical protein
MRGDESAPRIAYADGVLEIMSPSINHESVKSNIGCLVEIWMDRRGLEYRKLGSWTLKKKAERKGAEPDECYAIGDGLEDPAHPDLVIEVVWTRGGMDKLAIYAELAVPEVWYWKRARSGFTSCAAAPMSSLLGARSSKESISRSSHRFSIASPPAPRSASIAPRSARDDRRRPDRERTAAVVKRCTAAGSLTSQGGAGCFAG